MKLLKFIFCAVFLQVTTGQVFAPGNSVSGQDTGNQPILTQRLADANAHTIRALPNHAIQRAGNLNVVNGVPFLANNMPNAHLAKNMPSANMAHVMPNAHMSNNMPNGYLANVLNDQAVLGNHNTGGVINNADMAALTKMANINGNTATFNLANGGFTVTSGSPGSPGFGIQVLADALEVGGMVAVNGQIPIYGAVTVNGHLPTDGSASVRYTCAGSSANDGVLI
ncbi:uncharacterized protein LOC120625341 [Pararge aegeria]|nr:uncharacterized protein LOC120625341 [Pararge aegeria]